MMKLEKRKSRSTRSRKGVTSYIEEEIRLKKMMKDIEQEKRRQEDFTFDEIYNKQTENIQRRLQDEKKRDQQINFGAAEKTMKMFDDLFLKGKADQDVGDIEKQFDIDYIFKKKKVNGVVNLTDAENSGQDKEFNPSSNNSKNQPFEQSGADRIPGENYNIRQKLQDIENQSRSKQEEIKKQQQKNIQSQMDIDREFRPQVIGGAPVQGYGLNRGALQRQGSAEMNRNSRGYGQARYESEADMKGMLDRVGQARKDYLPKAEDVLPFLPTAKQIAENQATRNVREEMMNMRGHVLTSFQKIRNDLENLRTDVAKGDTRFKYAQAEFQDSLKREMASRDNQVMDVLDNIRQWNPNQTVLPLDQQYSQKTLAKVPGFTIPQLNFEAATLEIKQRLELLKNPNAFQNTAAQKLAILSTNNNTYIKPEDYIKAESIRSGKLMINPQSRYLVEVMEEEQERLDRLRQLELNTRGFATNHSSKNHSQSNQRIGSTPSERSRASSMNQEEKEVVPDGQKEEEDRPEDKTSNIRVSDTFEKDGKKLDENNDEIIDEVGEVKNEDDDNDEVEDLDNIMGEVDGEEEIDDNQGDEEAEDFGEEEQDKNDDVHGQVSKKKDEEF